MLGEHIIYNEMPSHIYCSVLFVPKASHGKHQPEIAIEQSL